MLSTRQWRTVRTALTLAGLTTFLVSHSNHGYSYIQLNQATDGIPNFQHVLASVTGSTVLHATRLSKNISNHLLLKVFYIKSYYTFEPNKFINKSLNRRIVETAVLPLLGLNANTPAKWSAYKVRSVIVLFVVLVVKVWSVSLIPKNHKRPWTY
jgi:hypothetical protein